MPFITKARKKNDPVLRSSNAKLNKYEQEIFDIYSKALGSMPKELNTDQVIRALREAVEAGNPMDGAIAFQWGDFVASLDKTVPKLAQQLATSANISAKALPKRIRIESSFTAQDPRAIAWAQQRAGARILGITKETQKAVAETIARGLKTQLKREEVIDRITKIVGLDSRQARALGNFYENNLMDLLEEGFPYEEAVKIVTKLSKEYRNRLLIQRATRIARTETLAAANAGRMLSWAEADAQGLLPAGSEKRWKTATDERTCPICGPLHNTTVGWEDSFPTGDTMPPNHPNCRCTAVIVPAEPTYEKSVEKRYYRFADGEETWRNYDYRWRKIANEMKRRIGKCQRCGKKSDLTVDHKKRLKDGGAKYDRKNLRVLCRSCNGRASRLGTKLRKQEDLYELFMKHAPGKHNQQNHAGSRKGSKFYASGGKISEPLFEDSSGIGEAKATMSIMEEMLEEEFTQDEGVRFTNMALNIDEGMDAKVRIATADDGVAGAIQYMDVDREKITALYGDAMEGEETNIPPHIYISYLGSTGLVDKTGSALAESVFEEAASKNMAVYLESASAGASAFWEKMGMKKINIGSGDEFVPSSFSHSLSISGVKELVDNL